MEYLSTSAHSRRTTAYARKKLCQSDGKETVRNGTVLLPRPCHCYGMGKKKSKKESYVSILAKVKKEMAKPRVSESAQMEAKQLRAETAKT
jgi:hypothetical protein